MSADLTEPSTFDARLRADPLADDIVARILDAGAAATPPLARWDAIALVEREAARWESNAALATWQADPATPAPIARALEDYLRQARRLPDWADAAQIGCAEAVFADTSLLACALLPCASLPESLVAASGLEADAGEQLRAASALLFATMRRGGLLDADGAGLAQVLRLRLSHALQRHLVVRGNPAHALAHGAAIPALLAEGPDRWRLLFARGWDVRTQGLPWNQEALAHTLLGFHYVFLRSLRRLGLGLGKEEEGAWLHAWNVVGHLLGVEGALLTATMAQAAGLCARLQRDADGVARRAKAGDPRPALAFALMRGLRDPSATRGLASFPLLLTRHLCARATVRALDLDRQVSRLARARFALGLGTARVVDAVARLLCPGLSIARLATRILGYRLAPRMAIVPEEGGVAPDWERDARAPRWVNAIEYRFRRKRAARAGRKAAAC